MIAVSYDVYGFGREIETYLFRKKDVDKKKACQLREIFERLLSDDCKNRGVHDEGTEVPFEEWVKEQGIWCQKIQQYRVEPLEMGSSQQYNAFCIEQGE